jgi:hypothetical protein
MAKILFKKFYLKSEIIKKTNQNQKIIKIKNHKTKFYQLNLIIVATN